MRLLKALVVAATTLSVLARPLHMTRQGQDTNILVLKFAATLEMLEAQFYQKGIEKFSPDDFTQAGFSSTAIVTDQLTTIQADEQAHLDFLTKGLNAFGASPPDNCQFNFDSALKDVPTMAAVARTVEMVGVAAYAGAASLISDPQLLTAAATILTAEARHQTILNAMSGVGSPIPQAFDIAMTPSEVLAIAGPFISGCDLGVPANKPLTVTNSDTPGIGSLLDFDFEGKDSGNGFHCQMLVGGVVNSISLPLDKCVVPEGINGPVALFITQDSQPLANNVVLRASANSVVAGPTIAFIDSQPNPLSQLLRAGVSSPGSGSSGQDVSGQDLSGSGSGSGPNFQTGDAAGGAVIVNGWTNLPSGEQPPSSDNGSSQDGQISQGQDSQSQDGQSQDGQSQDGQSQDGQSQDGQSQDGQSQDGQSQDGQDGQSQDGQDGQSQDGQDGQSQDGQDGQSQDGQQPPSDPNAAGGGGAVIISSS